MVGGYDFFKSEFNRAIQARRQPGSAFKPFVFIAALESGLTPASVVDDSPIEYPAGKSGKTWKPDNYDRKFRGPVTLQQAIEDSINVAAVKVQEQIGIRRTVEVARRLGVESPLGENLSIALGTSDLTLLELTSAYGAIANQGTWMRPTAIRYNRRAAQAAGGKRSSGQAGVSRDRLRAQMPGERERGTRAAAKAWGDPRRPKRARPTISNAWFVATPLALRVWVGYDRPRSLGRDETGPCVAVPIWTAFMTQALAGTPIEEFPIPDRVVMAPVDLAAAGACARPVMMAFVAGTEPKVTCGPAKHMPALVGPPRPESTDQGQAASAVGPTLPTPQPITPAPIPTAAAPSATAPALPPPSIPAPTGPSLPARPQARSP